MADEHRVSKSDKFIDAVKDLPILFSIFGKANTWIKNDVFPLNPRSKGLI